MRMVAKRVGRWHGWIRRNCIVSIISTYKDRDIPVLSTSQFEILGKTENVPKTEYDFIENLEKVDPT
jgi:hypothetical protein